MSLVNRTLLYYDCRQANKDLLHSPSLQQKCQSWEKERERERKRPQTRSDCWVICSYKEIFSFSVILLCFSALSGRLYSSVENPCQCPDWKLVFWGRFCYLETVNDIKKFQFMQDGKKEQAQARRLRRSCQSRKQSNCSAHSFRVSLFISLITANWEAGIKYKTATVRGVDGVQCWVLNHLNIMGTLITRPWTQQKPLTQ